MSDKKLNFNMNGVIIQTIEIFILYKLNAHCSQRRIKSPEHCLKLKKVAKSATYKQSKNSINCVVIKMKFICQSLIFFSSDSNVFPRTTYCTFNVSVAVSSCKLFLFFVLKVTCECSEFVLFASVLHPVK